MAPFSIYLGIDRKLPDLRFRPEWSDKEKIADALIEDLSRRSDYTLKDNIVSKTILSPTDWRDSLNLHRGSGLGLGHKLKKI